MAISIGYVSKAYKAGAATALSAEPASQVGTTKTYQINNAAKRRLDPNTAVVVKHNGGTVVPLANIASINMMSGSVTFAVGFTPTGTVTFDGKYLPLAEVLQVKSWDGTPECNTADVTMAGSSNPNGYEQNVPTTLKFQGQLVVYGKLADAGMDAVLSGRQPVMIVLDVDGTGAALMVAWVLLTQSQSPVKGKDPNTTTTSFKLYDQSPTSALLNGVQTNAAFDFQTT